RKLLASYSKAAMRSGTRVSGSCVPPSARTHEWCTSRNVPCAQRAPRRPRAVGAARERERPSARLWNRTAARNARRAAVKRHVSMGPGDDDHGARHHVVRGHALAHAPDLESDVHRFAVVHGEDDRVVLGAPNHVVEDGVRVLVRIDGRLTLRTASELRKEALALGEYLEQRHPRVREDVTANAPRRVDDAQRTAAEMRSRGHLDRLEILRFQGLRRTLSERLA